MKIRAFGNNLWQLTRLVAFNAYLVREDDGLTIIDTGLAGSDGNILQAAEKIGLPLTRIGLTHAHTDHVGSLDALSSALPGVEIALSERTAQFLQGNLALRPDEPQAELRGGFVKRETEPTRILAQGDMFGSLRVVEAPGHSPDHIAFFDERDGTLIAGDAFQTQGGIAVAGVRRWLFPLPAMATWHLPTALKSARTLRELNPTRLAVGHGRLLENPAEAMDHALAAAGAALHG